MITGVDAHLIDKNFAMGGGVDLAFASQVSDRLLLWTSFRQSGCFSSCLSLLRVTPRERAKRVRVPVVTESPQTCPPLHCRLPFSASPPSHHHFRHDGPMCLIRGQGHTRLLSHLPSPTISHAHGHGIRLCQAMGFDQRRSRLVLV